MSQFGQSDLGYRPRPRKTIANRAASLAVSDVVAYAPPCGFKTAATIVTAGAATYTAKDLLSGVILRDPTGASRTDVLPTCTLIAASFPGICSGSSLDFIIRNTADADEIITLTVGAGMTAYSGTILTISRSETGHFTLLFAVSAAGVVTADLYRTGNPIPVPGDNSALAQAAATTTVTVNALSGVILGFSQTLTASAAVTYTLSNTYIRSTSVVLVSVVGYSGTYDGTAGFPCVSVGSIATGSCTIVLFNPDAASLVGAVKVGFLVIQ